MPAGTQPLEEMLCRLGDRLLAYLDRHIPSDLRRVIDARDLAQDSYINAARCFHTAKFDGPDPAWRWLATIGRNCLTDAVRAQRAAKRGGGGRVAWHGRLQDLHGDEAGHSCVIDLLEQLGVDRRTPSKSAMRREFLSMLSESLHRLTPPYREAITYRYIDGLSLQQTASKLSRTEDSTRKLCVRGLLALRGELRTMSMFA